MSEQRGLAKTSCRGAAERVVPDPPDPLLDRSRGEPGWRLDFGPVGETPSFSSRQVHRVKKRLLGRSNVEIPQASVRSESVEQLGLDLVKLECAGRRSKLGALLGGHHLYYRWNLVDHPVQIEGREQRNVARSFSLEEMGHNRVGRKIWVLHDGPYSPPDARDHPLFLEFAQVP